MRKVIRLQVQLKSRQSAYRFFHKMYMSKQRVIYGQARVDSSVINTVVRIITYTKFMLSCSLGTRGYPGRRAQP